MPCQRSEAITNGDCLSESIHPACRVAARKEFSFLRDHYNIGETTFWRDGYCGRASLYNSLLMAAGKAKQ